MSALFGDTVFEELGAVPDDVLRLARAVRNVDFEHRQLRERLAAAHGLSIAEFNAIVIVGQSGATMTPTDLADYLRLSTSATTSVLDRLERAGLLARRPNPKDRRSLLISALEEGERLVDQVSTAYVATFERVVAEHCRSREQLEVLIGQLECLADAVAVADHRVSEGASA